MITEDRINLRNKLFNEFVNLKAIKYNKHEQCYIRSLEFLNNVLNSNEELKNDYYLYVSEFRTEKEALYCLTHQDDYTNHMCSICNSNISIFSKNNYKYRMTCSKKCAEAYTYTDAAMQKKRDTCLKNNGTEYAMQNENIRIKSKESIQKIYSVDNVSQAQPIKDKKKESTMNHYNVENPFQAEEIKEKIKQTNYNNLGVENIQQLAITNYDIWSNDEKLKKYIIDQYNKKGMFLILNDIYPFFNITRQSLYKKLKLLNLFDYFYIQKSQLEIDFENFLKLYNINYDHRNRSALVNDNIRREIDFLINNIGIEINDINTHNSMNSNWVSTYKDPLYHQQKSLLAIEKGIRLIHLWEWELRNEDKWSKISNWLLNELNQSKLPIDINQCQLIYINKELEQQFYNLYSIKDYQESDICLGLTYNNQLYQIMSFKNIDNQWYLINYGTAYSYNINYQYILDSFIQLNFIQNIKVYCDLDKEDCCLYE